MMFYLRQRIRQRLDARTCYFSLGGGRRSQASIAGEHYNRSLFDPFVMNLRDEVYLPSHLNKHFVFNSYIPV